MTVNYLVILKPFHIILDCRMIVSKVPFRLLAALDVADSCKCEDVGPVGSGVCIRSSLTAHLVLGPDGN